MYPFYPTCKSCGLFGFNDGKVQDLSSRLRLKYFTCLLSFGVKESLLCVEL